MIQNFEKNVQNPQHLFLPLFVLQNIPLNLVETVNILYMIRVYGYH